MSIASYKIVWDSHFTENTIGRKHQNNSSKTIPDQFHKCVAWCPHYQNIFIKIPAPTHFRNKLCPFTRENIVFTLFTKINTSKHYMSHFPTNFF